MKIQFSKEIGGDNINYLCTVPELKLTELEFVAVNCVHGNCRISSYLPLRDKYPHLVVFDTNMSSTKCEYCAAWGI